MRFKNYKISSSDGEGTRLSKSFGMYDISTAVTIHGECGVGDAEANKPKICCASRDKWLAIAAGCDLSVFDLAVGVDHKWSISFKETDQIIVVTFLPDDDLLLVVLASGVVAVCVPNVMKNNAPLMKQELLLPSMDACSVAIVNELERYAICVLEPRGTAHFLKMDKFNMAIKRELDQINPVRLVFSSERAASGNASFVIWALNRFAFFPQRRGDCVRTSSVHPRSSAAFSDWFRLADDVRAVKNVGQFVVALTADNRLVFYNLQLTHLLTMELTFTGATRGGDSTAVKALDFEFLDVDAFCDFKSDVRILFTIQTDRGTEFVLKSLADPTTLFNTCCADYVVLIPHSTPGDDSNIIFIEAFTDMEPNDVIVRFVSEAQPSLRLKRLLDNGRFTEALEFAKVHDLSLDVVYVALIRKCQDEILSEYGYEEIVFGEMMKYLTLLSDHDEACDYCVAALRGVDKYEHIVKLLEFTQREKIKDADTTNAIAEFRYELGSYRLLFGVTHVGYDRESEWPAFLSIENHTTMFDAFCRTGKITEARIVFDRYPSEISGHFAVPGATDRLLDFFSASITENPGTCVAIAEFLESSLLKFFLLDMDIQRSVANSNHLFEFLINTARNLERIQSKGFPENSLFFALAFSRGLTTLKENCLTGDQQLEPIMVLDHLKVDTYDESFNSGRLNVLVRNLKNLARIHRVYQCPMSYSEYLNSNIHSICSSILDRVRTAQSVRNHIESFVFPYMVEHNLDKNDMLYRYIKNLASMLYRGSSQYSNSWDQLCLQIAESIVDADLRCKAVIEISAGSIPPWSEQLMTVVKNTLTTNADGIDPSLIQQLRVECRRAELGQIFVAYHIPLNFRNSQMDSISLGGLLQFIFRNSDKDPSIRINDAFKIVSIYECLAGHTLLTRIECYRLYAISIVAQLQDEYDLTKLIDFFHLIKSTEERSEVAWKLVYYLKSMIRETTVKKIQDLRLIWLTSMLCILERFVTKDRVGVEEDVQQARNIRTLQVNHKLVIGFTTLDNGERCVAHLINFITSHSVRSLFEVVAFGQMLSLPIRRIFETIVNLQIEQGLVEASLTTLEFYIERQLKPELVDLDTCLHVCTTAMWKITQAAVESGTEYEPLVSIVKLFKSTLPVLIDWSTQLLSVSHVESFCAMSIYVTLLGHILDLCVVDKSDALEREEAKTPDEYQFLKKTEKMYTNRRRVAAFLPQNENSFFDHNTVIRNAAIVASSVVKRPVNSENFDNEMVEYWNRLFDALSSHKLLEVFARQFAQTLPCFASIRQVNGPVLGLRQCVSELCQKILNVPTADLPLAAHLLLCLTMPEMKTVLQDLRRWVANNRKNVRISLNVIRLSLFVLIESRDFSLQQQLAMLFEATLWQKRFTKLGILVNSPNNLRKDVVQDLVGEFVRILLEPAILKRFCQEMKVPKQIMLNYAIELCRVSSSVVKDRERFAQTISTAKAALREVDVDEEAIQEVMSVINQLCPYNYEVLELLLKQMEEWTSGRRLDYETWTKDRLLLLSFLMIVKREKGYSKDEVQWYRTRLSSRSGVNNSTISSMYSDDTSLLDEETQSAVPNSVSTLLGGLYRKQDVFETNFPPHSGDRLPFHLFLSPENKDRLSQAVIHHELSIYNVLKWIAIIEETREILQHSRTSLIVIAITNDVSNAIKYKRELTSFDLDQIRMLSMRDLDRRLIIVKSSCQRFRKLPLCDIKIKVFKICYEIANDSIVELSKQSAEEETKCEDEAAFIDFRNALKQTLAQSTTDLLLSKNNLLDSNTSALSNKAIALISYICSNCVDWNDNVNIESHFRVVEEIAKVNEVDLNEVYDELILNWLPGTEGVEVGNTLADPDATIDFLGADGGGGGAASLTPTSIDDEVPLPVLYSDPSLSKIVFLLNRCDPEQKARTIFMKFQQELCQTPVSYTTKMRTACCLIRYLSNEQMQRILNMDKNNFCIELVSIITARLLNVCRVGISIRDYANADKVEFVRSILSPQSFRQTSEIAHLITCVIVDNGIRDIALIDKAAYRLMQLRMTRPLMALLEYTRRFAEAKYINNIATYYARVFESNYDKIIDYSDDVEQASEHTRKKLALVHHLIGCPVEGGTNFSRAKTLLSSMSCAASLVAIAGSSTEKISEVRVPKTGDIVLNRDYI